MDTLADYAAWRSKQQQQNVGAAQVVLGAREDAPDVVAGDLTLASEFGKATGNPIPPLPLVKEYRPLFQQAVERERNSTILSSSPMLAEWLRSPTNAAVAADDLQGLSWWETAFKASGNALSRGVQRVPQSYSQFMANGAAQRAGDQSSSFGDILSDQMSFKGQDGAVVGKKLLAGPDDLYWATSRFLTAQLSSLLGRDEKQIAAAYQQQAGKIANQISAIPMSPPADAFRKKLQAGSGDGDLGQQFQKFINDVASDPAGFAAFLAETSVESAPSLAAAGAVTLATRSPMAGAVFMGGNSAVLEMGTTPADFFREKGIDISTPEGAMRVINDPVLMKEANDRGATRGLIIGLMDGLSGGVAGKTLAKSPAGNLVLQSFAQAFMGAAGEAGGQLASGQKLNLSDIIIEGLAEFVTAPLEVASMSGESVMRRIGEAKAATERKAMFEALSGEAQGSKLRERLPEKFREFVAAATANGPVENVYVPADAFVGYFQGIGVDPYALIDQLDGVTRDDLDVALAGGGDLQIPTATYAAKIAGSEHDAFLIENMKFDPDQMTATEAKEFNAKAQEAQQEAYDLAERLRLEEEGLRTFEQEIYDTMVSRLRTAGRSTEVATTEALLYPAFYRVMAERSGMGVDEFMKTYPLPQVRGAIPDGMQLKDVGSIDRVLAEARQRKTAGPDTRKTLLEFISDRGGILDPGGELKARDAEVIRRGRGKKTLKLARKGVVSGMADMLGGAKSAGHGIDDVARAAIEAGYMANDPAVLAWQEAQRNGTETPDITRALWAAIDLELRGQPEYSVNDKPSAEADALDQIEAYLSSLGKSLDDSDAEIKAAIAADQEAQASYGQVGGDVTQTPAFRKWFGDSKVVDESGKPLVVYHGTNQQIDAFDISRGGASTGANAGATKAFFFTSSREVASQYAAHAGKRVVANVAAYEHESARLQKEVTRLEKVAQRTGDWNAYEQAMAAWEEHETNALQADDAEGVNIVEAYLSIQNPMVVDFGGGRLSTERDLDTIIDEARSAGNDGLILRNLEDSPQMGVVSDQFVAFDPTQIKSVNNNGAFDPNDPRIMFQAPENPRGSIQFPGGGVGNGDTIINLFQSADLSTTLHESGHYFLQVLRDLAGRGEIEAQGDMLALKDWWRENAADVARDGKSVTGTEITADDVKLALDAGTTGSSAKDAAIDVGMHEQFARGFEAYLMEGKSPNASLRGAFEKFRAWLISIYQKLARLNVSLSPEVRAVFDRMLASDAEIAKAKADISDAGPIFATAEQMGLTDEEFAKFRELRAQAEDDAKARLLREVMAPIKREQERAFREEREKVRAEVERQINAYPAYRAWEWMGNRRWLGDGQPEALPDMRLSKDVLVERYGPGVLETLPRGKQTVYAVEGGLDPDDAAGWFGFGSGDELVKALERAPKRSEAIEAETDKIMRERHGDVLNDGTVEVHALDAIHTSKRGEWIAAELKAMVEVAGTGNAMTAKEARAAARLSIARMKTRDAMNANRFLAAERKAAEEAASLGAQVALDKVWLASARRRVETQARRASGGKVAPDTVATAIDAYNARFDTTQTTYTTNPQTRTSKSGQQYTIPGGERTATSLGYNDLVTKLVDAKRRQLLNHALYMEARNVADEVEKAERFVARLGKTSTREKIAGAGRRDNAQVDYLGAIDEILDRYDFRKMSGRAEDRRGKLLAFIEQMKAAGRENELAIPENVMREAGRSPYKTLPVEQLRGVIDSLKNLEHVALRWDKLIDAQQQRDLDESVESIVEAFDANMPKRPPGRVNTGGEVVRNNVRKFFDLVLNATTLLREIDGFKDGGPAYRNIKAPIDSAMNRLITRKKQAADDLAKLYEVYTKDERRRMSVREHMPDLGFALSKWERIAVALNTGNEGNYSRLTDPKVRGALTEAQVAAILTTLDERDARFVQSVWDYVGSFKADIAARERRTTGVEPAWVDPSPVTIAGMTLRGGYYPLKYDPRLSSLARDDQAQDVAQALQAGRFGKAQTKRGHLEARAQSSGRDIELDMSVLHRHVNQVIYDLELSEPVSNAWRILQDGRTRNAFIESGKTADFDALEIWLKDVAEGELKSADIANLTARTLKSNFTAAKLAFNLVTVAMQLTSLPQSAVVVGKKNLARGVAKTVVNPVGTANEIAAKSAFMASRQTTFNKDIYDFYNDPKMGPVASRWGEIKSEIIGPLSFWLMTKVQFYTVDVPTWIAGYEQGLRKFGNDEEKAIAHADDVVKRAQASGLFSDRSAIERGSVSRTARQNDVVRLFTTLGSYMFAKFNAAYERSAKAGRTIREEGVSAKSAAEALSWSLDMVFLFSVEAVLTAAIKGQLPGGDDDDENWLAWLAKKTGLAVMSTIPGVRDAGSALEGFGSGGAYGSAVGDAVKGAAGVVKVVGSAFTGEEVSKTDVKAIINATGLATGLPSTQINRAVDAAWRQSEGEDVSPLEYLIGKMGKGK